MVNPYIEFQVHSFTQFKTQDKDHKIISHIADRAGDLSYIGKYLLSWYAQFAYKIWVPRSFTHFRDRKGDPKFTKCGAWVDLNVIERSAEMVPFDT